MNKNNPKTMFATVLCFFTGAIIFLVMGMGVIKEGTLHNAFLIIGVIFLIATLLVNKKYLDSIRNDKRDDN